ncbi:MAG: Uma2 family endonuclease [Isosphaeraceae bacterium]
MSKSTTVERPPAGTPTAPPQGETRILIPGATWELYSTFVHSLPEGCGIRVAFDGEDMEIMVTGHLHDGMADLLDAFFKAVARGVGLRFKPQSQTTWIRPEIQKGLEADRGYFIEPGKIASATAAQKAGSNNVRDYPNPDLAIEVEISRPRADRQAIYGAMKVAELWTFDGKSLIIRRLGDDGRYQVTERSGFLPLRADDVPHWLLDEDTSDYSAWTDRITDWARMTLPRT